MGMASRVLYGTTWMPSSGSHWPCGLHTCTSNRSVYIAIAVKWHWHKTSACPQDGASSPGALAHPHPVKVVHGLQPSPVPQARPCLTLHKSPGLQPQLMTLKPASSLSLPSELQAARMCCLLDAAWGYRQSGLTGSALLQRV